VSIQHDHRVRWDAPRGGADKGSRGSSPKPSGLSSRLRLVFIVALAAFLIWEVITRSLAAYFAGASPEMALRLRPTDPVALLNLAESWLSREQNAEAAEPVAAKPSSNPKIDGTSTDADTTEKPTSAPSIGADPKRIARIRSLAESSLFNDPLNARAFRILGEISQETSDDRRTKTLMQAAVRRSLAESAAVYWLMRNSYEEKNYRSAIRYADILLRTRPQLIGPVMPMLGKMAETPAASAELKRLLAENPPWRSQFLASLSDSVSDARTPLDVFLSLKGTATPPTAADLRRYLDFLIGHKFYELAYYTWLQFLPEEQLSKVGHLSNGDFELPTSTPPFDWALSQGSGATIEIAPRPEHNGQHALFMEFGPGRVDTFGVTQMILLAPGRYQFRGTDKVDIVSQRGLKWRVTCAGATTPLGESSSINGTEATWKDFEFSFTVADDCPAQYVSLVFDARSASEQFISGSAWYDDLEIVPQPASESAQ
jgi:hypothetical protein